MLKVCTVIVILLGFVCELEIYYCKVIVFIIDIKLTNLKLVKKI